jgi:hypothetical protein
LKEKLNCQNEISIHLEEFDKLTIPEKRAVGVEIGDGQN